LPLLHLWAGVLDMRSARLRFLAAVQNAANAGLGD